MIAVTILKPTSINIVEYSNKLLELCILKFKIVTRNSNGNQKLINLRVRLEQISELKIFICIIINMGNHDNRTITIVFFEFIYLLIKFTD